MQRLWRRGLEWDPKLPTPVREEWIRFFQEMKNLNNVTFERPLTPPQVIEAPTLCIFSDASNEAFGACAYIRWQTESSSFNIRFIAANSRVVRLKPLTVPRLELQGAVLATRLYQSIMEETRIQFMKAVFFTESNIVLSWIRSQSREFKPFVSARVAEIQSNSDPSQWRHVPGEFNVADDASRGIPVERLTDRWKHGPEFLGLPGDDWPNEEFAADQSEVEKERRKPQVILKLANQPELIDCKKFSNWRRLVRVSAYVLRFISNLRMQLEKNRTAESSKEPNDGLLTPQELKDAEIYWVKESQKGLLGSLKKGYFQKLSPFTDSKGIIRVGRRADEALISYKTLDILLCSCKLTGYHY